MKTRRPLPAPVAVLLTALVALLAFAGCRSQGPDDCLCTTEHVAITFMVVDDTGTPMPGFTIKSRIERTDEVLQIDQDLADQGVYIVATDSHLGKIRASGETVVVEGTLGQRSFTENFVVNAPGPDCICHVGKVSGPDTVMIGRGSS